MLNRLPIALARLKAGNNSNKVKNESRQLLYSLHRSKNITEQVYKRLIGIIEKRMETIFMNTENSKQMKHTDLI